MRLKNDKEREQFLSDYRNEKNGWYAWKEDDDIDRVMWRRDFPDCALIVEEQRITYEYPHKHITWAVLNRYIIVDWKKPFADGSASITTVRNKLKELTKAGKEI